MRRNVLFITVDQWRGDSLSCMGHPVVETPNTDALAAGGVLFANHWANAAPCGPSRACLYTGMYMQNHRSVMNGTPLDARFTNVALEARRAGYDPVLFGYTDTSVDPRTVPAGDPRTFTYEGVLPGFTPIVNDPWEAGGLEWGKWLADHGIDVPSQPTSLYEPDTSYPGADKHASTWAPTRFPAELSETAFITEKATEWLSRHGGEPFFMHISYFRPHPPRRNPAGYHDLYSEEQVGPFTGFATPEEEAGFHPANAALLALPLTAAPHDGRERRQLRATYYGAQKEVDDQLGRLFAFLEGEGLASNTLVVLTSDHGEMGGDHWLLEKCGYWDESFHIPLVVRDPFAEADATRGLVVRQPTESVDVSATILDWLGLEVPRQVDGWPLTPYLRTGVAPEHWRAAAHWEWDFRHAQFRVAEQYFGIPSEHCSLAVLRNADAKYVQFAADPDILPALLFDLQSDPGHTRNLAAPPSARKQAGTGTRIGEDGLELALAQDMLRWRMRNLERTLTNCYLAPGVGPVWAAGRLAMSGTGARPGWDEHEVREALATMGGFFDGDEPVDELSHALQSATHAIAAGAGPELMVAAFLHDVGRSPAVVPLFPEMPHELAGGEWLEPRTSAKVAWLVRAHVPAKVFLVESDPEYLARLSPESVLSLRRQKGPAEADHALARWAAHPWWPEALDLRRWDDAAKVPGAATASLDEIFALLEYFSTVN